MRGRADSRECRIERLGVMGMGDGESLLVDWSEVEALRTTLHAAGLAERDLAVFDAIITALRGVAAALSAKSATIARLRKLLFGPRADRRSEPVNPDGRSQPAADTDTEKHDSHSPDTGASVPATSAPRKRRGH